jgi:hypothetical protein
MPDVPDIETGTLPVLSGNVPVSISRFDTHHADDEAGEELGEGEIMA